MRSADVQQPGMFSYVSVDARVPSDHPIRKLRELVDGVLREMDGLFAARYAKTGRPSIPPERLLRASLLQVVYSVRSGADKGYDTHAFVAALHDWGIQPHIARKTAGRRSAISDDIAATAGYAISQQIRKRIEQPFGWTKTFGGLRKLMHIGLSDVKAWTLWVFATYNLIRIGGLEEWWEPAPT